MTIIRIPSMARLFPWIPFAAWQLTLALTAVSCTPRLSRDQMEEDLTALSERVKREWIFAENRDGLSEIDLNALRDHFRDRIQDSASRLEFLGLLEEYLASLNDDHTDLEAWDVQTWPPRTWGLSLIEVKEGIAVANVDSDNHPSSLRPGDLVVKVDGVPVETAIGAVSRRVRASTDRSRRRTALRVVQLTKAKRARVVFRRPAGSDYEVSLVTKPTSPLAQRVHDWITSRVLEDGVGYLRIATFAPNWALVYGFAPTRHPELQEAKAELSRAFAQVSDCKGLIIDLRGNPGGAPGLSLHAARHLLPHPFRFCILRARDAAESRAALVGGFGEFSEVMDKVRDGTWPEVPWDPPGDALMTPYEGHLVVLIDEGTTSAAEILAACLADLKGGVRFVGRPTGGAAGSYTKLSGRLKHSLAWVRFSAVEILSPDGRRIEGHGVHPDLMVRWTVRDLMEGKDPDMEAALKVLRDER